MSNKTLKYINCKHVSVYKECLKMHLFDARVVVFFLEKLIGYSKITAFIALNYMAWLKTLNRIQCSVLFDLFQVWFCFDGEGAC